MKYSQFIILLCVSLFLIVTSGICLGSISKLPDSVSSKKSMTTSSSIVLVIGIIIFLISMYTLYEARTKQLSTIKPVEVSTLSVIFQTLLGIIILICGIVIQNTASALDESGVEKRNILNSATAIIVVGSVLTGKLILDKYNTSVTGIKLSV
jgi:hypothetical protein